MKKVLLLMVFVSIIIIVGGCVESTYQVLFVTDEPGRPNSLIKFDKGDTLEGKMEPHRDGYTFAGYYYDEDYNEKYNNEEITRNFTLYIKWEHIYQTITYYYGEGIMQTETYYIGEELSDVEYPKNTDKPGYTFTGWDNEIPDYMPPEDVTIIAQYEEIEVID
jgi:uncharacterized repeat protein (TIGR02543 family)